MGKFKLNIFTGILLVAFIVASFISVAPVWAASPTVANPIPNQWVEENAIFNFQFALNTFNDPDIGDSLAYSAQLNGGGGLPAWLNFNSATRTFSGVPSNGDVGTLSIDVTADDGNGGTVTDTFNIVIESINGGLTVINAIPDKITNANNVFSFQFVHDTFAPNVNNSLTYTAQLNGGGALPGWLSFSAASRNFTGTPSNGDIGVISIVVTADNGLGDTITDTFNIEVVAAPTYSGAGDGLDEESAYIITDCEQLQEMSNNPGAWYRLGNDIDCSDTASWHNGAGFVPIGTPASPFLGVLAGDGFTVSDLTINRPATDHVGLFGYAGGYSWGAIASHFMLEDVSITGQNYVGGVAGYTRSFEVIEVGITGEVNGVHMVGGAAGYGAGHFNKVYSHVNISGVPGSGVGGGLIGQNGGFISSSYSTGTIPDGVNKGGLVGDDLGSGGVFVSFWDTQTSGNNTSDEGTGKTTAEMKNVATFTDTNTVGLWSAWDFVGNPNDDTADDDIWDIDSSINQGYPYLTALTTLAAPDTDGDSIIDTIEQNGPNTGDGNNDGTPDSQQSNVASLLDPVTNQYVTLAVSETCEFSDIFITQENDHSAQDSGFSYRVGFINFTATGCEDDQTEVSLYYHGVSSDDLTVRKYNPNTNAYFTITNADIAALTAPLSGSLVTYLIVDNSELDINPASGVITDPVGLGIGNVGAPNTGLGLVLDLLSKKN